MKGLLRFCKAHVRWLLVGLFCWLGFLLWQMPAAWALRVSGLPLAAESVSGSAWSGTAYQAMLPWGQDWLALGDLNWYLDWASLLRLSPCVRFDSHYGQQQIEAWACGHRDGSFSLQEGWLRLPAALVQGTGLPLGGEFLIRLDQLSMADGAIRALSGSGQWRQARVHSGQAWLELGQVDLAIGAAEAGVVQVVMQDRGSGVLGIDLVWQQALDGHYSLQGEVQLRPESPPGLGGLLALVGEKGDGGRFRVQFAK